MSSKRRLRRNACDGKRRYETQDGAIAGMIRLVRAKKPPGKMAVYKCQFCHGFHFGHPNKRQIQSLRATRKGWAL